MEWEDENGQIDRLAIDCTITTYENKLKKKLSGITRKLASGELSSLKYHVSEFTEDKGNISRVPQVVLVLEPEKITGLCNNYSQILNKQKGSKDKFSQNPLQIMLLSQIKDQLEDYSKRIIRALRKNSDNQELVDAQKKIGRLSSIIQDILAKKREILNQNSFQSGIEEWQKSFFRKVLNE